MTELGGVVAENVTGFRRGLGVLVFLCSRRRRQLGHGGQVGLEFLQEGWRVGQERFPRMTAHFQFVIESNE